MTNLLEEARLGVEDCDWLNLNEPAILNMLPSADQELPELMMHQCDAVSPGMADFDDAGSPQAIHGMVNQMNLNDFCVDMRSLDTVEKCQAQSAMIYDTTRKHWEVLNKRADIQLMTHAAKESISLAYAADQVMQQFIACCTHSLRSWSVEQRKWSYAPVSLQQAHNEKLDAIDQIFEQCGMNLWDWYKVFECIRLEVCKGALGSQGKPYEDSLGAILSVFIRRIENLMSNCFVVCEQPPESWIKAREANNPRSKLILKIQMLGGNRLGYRRLYVDQEQMDNSEIVVLKQNRAQCRLVELCDITKNTDHLPRISSNVTGSSGKLQGHESCFRLKTVDGKTTCTATFETMKLIDIVDARDAGQRTRMKRRGDVPNIAYHILVYISVNGGPVNSELHTTVVSLPIMALVRPDVVIEASGWWRRAFPQNGHLGDPLSPPTDVVHLEAWCRAFRLKFSQICEEEKTHSAPGVSPKIAEVSRSYFLPDDSLNLLCQKLLRNSNDNRIHREEFIGSQPVVNDFDIGTKQFDPKGRKFCEYVWTCAHSVRDCMQQEWKAGLIYGFADHVQADSKLRALDEAHQTSTLFIRFSDRKFNFIKVQLLDSGGKMLSFEQDMDKIVKLSNARMKQNLATLVKSNQSRLAGAKYIYQEQPLAMHDIRELWALLPVPVAPCKASDEKTNDYPNSDPLVLNVK